MFRNIRLYYLTPVNETGSFIEYIKWIDKIHLNCAMLISLFLKNDDAFQNILESYNEAVDVSNVLSWSHTDFTLQFH